MHERFSYAVECGRLGCNIAEEANSILSKLKIFRKREIVFACVLYQAFINKGYFVPLDLLQIILNVTMKGFDCFLNKELNNLRQEHSEIFTNAPIPSFQMRGKIYFVTKNLPPKIQQQVINFLKSIFRDFLRKSNKKKKTTSIRITLLEKKMYKKRKIFKKQTNKNIFLAMVYACIEVVSPIFTDFDLVELLNIFCVKQKDLLKLRNSL